MQRVIEVLYPEFKLVVTEIDLLKFLGIPKQIGNYSDNQLTYTVKDILKHKTEEQINKLFVHIERPSGHMLQSYDKVTVERIE